MSRQRQQQQRELPQKEEIYFPCSSFPLCVLCPNICPGLAYLHTHGAVGVDGYRQGRHEQQQQQQVQI